MQRMAESNDIYTLDQARYLTKAERLSALLRFNSMTEPLVYGRLHEHDKVPGFTHWIRKIKSIDSQKALRSPLAGEENLDIDIPLRLPLDDQFQNGDEVVLKIDVLPDNHHLVSKQGKLFKLCPVGNLERLKKISLDNIIVEDGEKVLVSESLWNKERKYYEKIHKENIKHLDNELAQAQKEVQNNESYVARFIML